MSAPAVTSDASINMNTSNRRKARTPATGATARKPPWMPAVAGTSALAGTLVAGGMPVKSNNSDVSNCRTP